MRWFASALLMSTALAAHAETPAELLAQLQAEAGGVSAERGRQLYHGKFQNAQVESCAACHTADPRGAGRHARTHKAIEPLAPAANPERFTDRAKVEKWFKRNCNEVLGRPCTAQEKADFAAYVLSVR